jgi:hypothetical protein
MPYIAPEARAEILGLERGPETVGELTFCLTAIVVDYIERKGGPTYSVLAEAKIAAFDTALELHDRVSRDYEDLKCAVNGDVFGPILDLTAPEWPVGHGDPPPILHPDNLKPIFPDKWQAQQIDHEVRP